MHCLINILDSPYFQSWLLFCLRCTIKLLTQLADMLICGLRRDITIRLERWIKTYQWWIHVLLSAGVTPSRHNLSYEVNLNTAEMSANLSHNQFFFFKKLVKKNKELVKGTEEKGVKINTLKISVAFAVR